jgi:hypothetical protein
MKRLLTALIIILAFLLTGCNEENKATTNPPADSNFLKGKLYQGKQKDPGITLIDEKQPTGGNVKK